MEWYGAFDGVLDHAEIVEEILSADCALLHFFDVTYIVFTFFVGPLQVRVLHSSQGGLH